MLDFNLFLLSFNILKTNTEFVYLTMKIKYTLSTKISITEQVKTTGIFNKNTFNKK